MLECPFTEGVVEMKLRNVLLGLVVLGVSIGTVSFALAADCAWPFKAEQ